MFVDIRTCFVTVPTNTDVKTHIVPNCVFPQTRHEHLAHVYRSCLVPWAQFPSQSRSETSTDVTRYREGPGTGQFIIRDGDIENKGKQIVKILFKSCVRQFPSSHLTIVRNLKSLISVQRYLALPEVN